MEEQAAIITQQPLRPAHPPSTLTSSCSMALQVVPAESVAHEIFDAARLGPEARAVTAWEAGLLMAEYFREHGKPILSGRTVVEVGAGIGMVGFAAAEVAVDSKVILTDGNDTAVSLLHTNKQLNEPWFGADAAQNVHVRTMKWDDQQVSVQLQPV